MGKIKRRLQQIKTRLEHQDYEMAELQLSLLSEETSLAEIIDAIHANHYSQAIELIDLYLHSITTDLVEYEDTELESLRAQLKELEEVIEALSEQKSEQLFLLNEFNTKQSLATGEIVQQILQLRKEIEQEKLSQKQRKLDEAKQVFQIEKEALGALKTQRAELEEKLESLDELDFEYDEVEEALDSLNEDIRQKQKTVKEKRQTVKEEESLFEEADEQSYEEAKQEYEQFEESYQEAKEDKVAKLSDKDAGLLKKLFRKAAKLCHPDTAADEFKDQAHEIMQQLNNARDNGDIETVKEFLESLQNGTAFVLASDQLTDREQIEAKIEELVAKLEEIHHDIEQINENETWQLISSLESWDAYFKQTIEELKDYFNQLQSEYDTLLRQPEEEEVKVKNDSFTQPKPPEPEYSGAEPPKSKPAQDNYWDDEF
ncbi:coiled-coil domain-containing protein [Thiomicrospira microaerophila]|uniref:hypothetical protein n=1 Tax=Thiomicrospira microaerophila TaxID=406020 RepID=UPI0005C832D9|nr:hypothetical protein [Thiomicrospira microaerophila]